MPNKAKVETFTKKLKKDIRLLGKSIEHWLRMRADPHGGDVPTPAQCALCKTYFSGGSGRAGCDGCPIANDAGLPDCDGTPYSDASEIFFDLKEEDDYGSDEWRYHSNLMIDFLRRIKRNLQAQLRRKSS